MIGVALDHELSSRMPSMVITPLAGLAVALGSDTEVAGVVWARALATMNNGAIRDLSPHAYLPPAQRIRKADFMSWDRRAGDGFNKMGQRSTPLRHLNYARG